MGVSYARAIESAGTYLVSRLRVAKSLPYSTFYDGEEATSEQLQRGMGLDGDWWSAEHLLDSAVIQLEEQGIVSTRQLSAKLSDDELNYLIELTPEGEAKLLAGYAPSYRNME